MILFLLITWQKSSLQENLAKSSKYTNKYQFSLTPHYPGLPSIRPLFILLMNVHHQRIRFKSSELLSIRALTFLRKIYKEVNEISSG